MTWNYRVMAIPHPFSGWDREITLRINDVYYYDNGVAKSYGAFMEPPVYRQGAVPGGSTLEEVREDLRLMALALEQPILCAGDRWPQEYKPSSFYEKKP